MGTALITGASAGLGREFAEQLAARGHDLVLVARDRGRLEALAADLGQRYAVAAQVLPADLADRAQLQAVADRVADPDRPVDLVVNNAGFGAEHRFVSSGLESEERALDVMVRAVMVLSHTAAGAMRPRGRGAILNVASVAGWAAMGHYSAIKSYVTVLSEGMAAELAGTGVTVTSVCPGFTHTEFHQRARMDMSRLPEPLWLDAPRVVSDALAAVATGRVVSVPGPFYRGLVEVMRVTPRPLIRRITGALAEGRRPST